MKLIARYFLLIFVITCTGSCVRKEITVHQSIIAIQPLDNCNQATIKFLSANIEKFYGCRVLLLPSKDIPLSFFNDSKSPRYYADSLLKFLASEGVDSINYVLGVTEKIFLPRREMTKATSKSRLKNIPPGEFSALVMCPVRLAWFQTFGCIVTTGRRN